MKQNADNYGKITVALFPATRFLACNRGSDLRMHKPTRSKKHQQLSLVPPHKHTRQQTEHAHLVYLGDRANARLVDQTNTKAVRTPAQSASNDLLH